MTTPSGVAVSLESARALSRLHFPATIIFASVDGEEQGLYGSKHLAVLLKSENVDIEAALNNDIVGGNTTPGDKFQDKQAVRVFSQGIPEDATPKQLRMIEMLGYAGDSPSRELARAITGVDATYFGREAAHRPAPYAGMGVNERYFHPVLEFRLDRFLRGGDHYSFNQEGFAAVALHGVARGLQPPTPGITGRRWRTVRRPDPLCRHALCRQGGGVERRHPRYARKRASAAGRGQDYRKQP